MRQLITVLCCMILWSCSDSDKTTNNTGGSQEYIDLINPANMQVEMPPTGGLPADLLPPSE